MKTCLDRHEITEEPAGEATLAKGLDCRFWMETLALTIVLGGLIAATMRFTGRDIEVLALAAALGLIKLATLVAGMDRAEHGKKE